MRNNLLIVLFVNGILNASALAADVDTGDIQCQSGGAFVLVSLHQLNACISYNKIQSKSATEIKNRLFKKYPKIQLEYKSATPLSASSKELVDGSPFDFSDNQNAKLLDDICEDTIGNMEKFTASHEWLEGLSCWQEEL